MLGLHILNQFPTFSLFETQFPFNTKKASEVSVEKQAVPISDRGFLGSLDHYFYGNGLILNSLTLRQSSERAELRMHRSNLTTYMEASLLELPQYL